MDIIIPKGDYMIAKAACRKFRLLPLVVTLLFFLLISAASAYYDRTPYYVLGPGDVIEVQAWDEENSDLLYVKPIPPGVTSPRGDPHQTRVSLGGRLYIPLVGAITVTGMTVKKLEGILRINLKKLTEKPQVAIFVVGPKGVKVDVLGEVGAPGSCSIPDGNPRERALLNYIKRAGGFAGYADLSRIHIIRESEDGKSKTINVNLMKISTEMDISQNIVLEDGDTVIVGAAINNIFVLGQVVSPGPQRYIYGASISDYIVMAGGFLKNSARDNIKIIRGDVQNPIIKDIKLGKFFEEGKKDEDEVTLKPRDIIFVEGNWVLSWADALSILKMVRDTISYPRDIRDAYIDLSGQKRPIYYPVED